MTVQVGEASNILLHAPAVDPREAEACGDLLSVVDSETLNVLAVTYTRSVDRWVSEYREHASAPPDRLAIISVGETMRSSAHSRPSQSKLQSTGPVVEAVANPGDLTEIGILISEYLSEWAAETRSSETRTVLCFDSLTALLQYTDLETAYRFLHTVAARVSTADAIGHYHLTAAAHDEQTVATLTTLFDDVVDVSEDEND